MSSNYSSISPLALSLPPIYQALDEMMNGSSISVHRPLEYLDTFMNIGKRFYETNLWAVAFQWDRRAFCSNLEINEDDRTCISKTSLLSFKSTYGTMSLIPGFRYYYEVKFLKGSNFKIGVAKSRRHLDIAFSDTEDGWAYYSNGQLRHNSKGDGPMYGDSFKGKDVIGVYIDLIDVSSSLINSEIRESFFSQRMGRNSEMLSETTSF
jgi:hypothetical protein